MIIELVSQSGVDCLRLEGELTVRHAKALHESLAPYCLPPRQSRTPLVVDASRVIRVDTAGAQVLHRFFQASQVESLKASEALLESFRILGLPLPSVFGAKSADVSRSVEPTSDSHPPARYGLIEGK